MMKMWNKHDVRRECFASRCLVLFEKCFVRPKNVTLPIYTTKIIICLHFENEIDTGFSEWKYKFDTWSLLSARSLSPVTAAKTGHYAAVLTNGVHRF